MVIGGARAKCLTFSLEISRALPWFASPKDIAFAREGLHVGRSFIAKDSGWNDELPAWLENESKPAMARSYEHLQKQG